MSTEAYPGFASNTELLPFTDLMHWLRGYSKERWEALVRGFSKEAKETRCRGVKDICAMAALCAKDPAASKADVIVDTSTIKPVPVFSAKSAPPSVPSLAGFLPAHFLNYALAVFCNVVTIDQQFLVAFFDFPPEKFPASDTAAAAGPAPAVTPPPTSPARLAALLTPPASPEAEAVDMHMVLSEMYGNAVDQLGTVVDAASKSDPFNMFPAVLQLDRLIARYQRENLFLFDCLNALLVKANVALRQLLVRIASIVS